MYTLNRRGFLAAAGLGTIACHFIGMRQASAAEYSLNYAGDVSADHPLSRNIAAAVEKIRSRTNCRVDIMFFPNIQLGSEMDMLTQLRADTNNHKTNTGQEQTSLVPVAAIIGIGFAFPDYADVWKAMDGSLGGYVRAAIDKFDVVTLDRIWNGGYRQITSSV